MTETVYFFCGYLLGSIPFGLILTRMAGLGDIRAIGSKNIGATNVLRTGRKDIAFLTLILDALKGTAAILIARYVDGSDTVIIAAGIGAFLGHLFPVWLRFKGGKGVATYIGIVLGVFWPAAFAFGAIWLTVAFTTRYSSVSAFTASVITPVVLYFAAGSIWSAMFAIMSVLLIARHHENIRRLLNGTEAKIGKKAVPAAGG